MKSLFEILLYNIYCQILFLKTFQNVIQLLYLNYIKKLIKYNKNQFFVN